MESCRLFKGDNFIVPPCTCCLFKAGVKLAAYAELQYFFEDAQLQIIRAINIYIHTYIYIYIYMCVGVCVCKISKEDELGMILLENI